MMENNQSEQEQTYPSYLLAADNHNYASGDFAITSPSTWAEGLNNTGKFIVSAAVSGWDSFYNSTATTVNWLGADLKLNDTAARLANLDSNLGAYYEENKDYVDLVGFIGSSLIPGTLAVKGLNSLNKGMQVLRSAESTGLVGANISRATGLLSPQIERYTVAAATEMSQASAVFSSINTNTLKALGAGFVQNTLEAAAFEVAATATLYKSPILEDMDAGDITKSIFTNALVGGTIGSVFTSTKILGGIKAFKKESDLAEKPFTYINVPGGSNPVDHIISAVKDKFDMPSPPTEGILAPKLTRLASDKQAKLDSIIGENFHKLGTPEIKNLVNQLQDSLRGAKQEVYEDLLIGLKKVDSVVAEDIKGLNPMYLGLVGENAGKVLTSKPAVIGLVDSLGNAKKTLEFVKAQKYSAGEAFDLLVESADRIEARYIWAAKEAKITPGMSIAEYDIPLLEKALEVFSAKKVGTEVLETPREVSLKILGRDGYDYMIDNVDDLFKHVRTSKEYARDFMLQGKNSGIQTSTEAIAKAVNMRLSYIEGSKISENMLDDLFASQAFQRDYTKRMIEQGSWDESKGLIDTQLLHTHAKVHYTPLDKQDLNLAMMVAEGASYLESKGKIYMEGVNRVVAKNLSGANYLFSPSREQMLQANSYGPGSKLFKFANGDYGTLEQWAEYTGAKVIGMIKEARDDLASSFQSVAYKMVNNPEAAVEFSSINRYLSSTTERYVLNETKDALIPARLADYEAGIRAGRKGLVAPDISAKLKITIANPETAEFISKHIYHNGERVLATKELRAAQGLENSWRADIFYPIKPNPQDYKFFAFVVDDSIQGAGHVSMIHATDAANLEKLIEQVPSEFRVIRDSQSKDFHKARGDYEFSRTLHESHIDSELQAKGVNSQFLTPTDPTKIVSEVIDYHGRSSDTLIREMVSGKFEKEFAEFRRLGDTYTSLQTSKYGAITKFAEDSVKNPYVNYIKAALGIANSSETPLWKGFNNFLEDSVSSIYSKIEDFGRKAKTPEELEKLNDLLAKYRVNVGYETAATEIYANHTAPKPVLSKFIRFANSVVSSLVTRLDPLNALNNIIGSNVLLAPEIRALESKLNSIKKSIFEDTLITVPNTQDKIKAIPRLIAESTRRFVSSAPEDIAMKELYKREGYITDLTSQFNSMLDDIALKGTESVADLEAKKASIFEKFRNLRDKGETWTGNKKAEELSRFVAADVARVLTGKAVQEGVLTPQAQRAWINTFVNRVQGNVIAAQRPLAFQGPVGQAIGLFQSYSFNMMQQMFRHVGEGRTKDAAMLMGLQTTFYGLNSLPAFSYINTHIVGTQSGNPEHRDLYSSMYGVFGESVGDLLLYGLPSNMLSTNLYSRGDLNPRQLTILPVNPADIAAVNAFSNVYTSVKETFTNVSNGASIWQSVLNGIEHNGISRPMAGIAQTVRGLTNGGEVYATSSKGTIMTSNDLLSWATASRLVGGKPLDEAIINDAMYRKTVYQANDSAKMKGLIESVKVAGRGGRELGEGELESFATSFVEAGGKQKEFNKWMFKAIKAADVSEANKLMADLKSPYFKNLQEIAGGRDLNDATSF